MPSPEAVANLLRLANPKADEGQDLLEYALLVALVAIVAIGAVTAVGQTIYTVFWKTIPASL